MATTNHNLAPSHAVPRSAKRAIVVLVVAAVLGGVFIMLRSS